MAINLQSIAKTQRATQPPRVVIHGPHGVGKSTLGANAYAPIFLPLEDGLTGLEVSAFPQLKNWAEVKDALNTLTTEKHEFGTAVIDSLDWLEPLIWAEVCRRHDKPSIEAFGYGKGYMEALPLWREFLDNLDALRARGMAVILIAHSEIKRFDAPDSDPFDRYQIKLHKGAAALVQEWGDIIGFANFETTTKKTDTGFGNTRTRGIGTGRRQLHVIETPAYVAKNRYAMPSPLPLDWNALVAAIQGDTTTAQPITQPAA
jgi:hypothetical protein